MSAELTCLGCNGRGVVKYKQHSTYYMCSDCQGSGRRRPELHEWDELEAERDQALAAIRESCADNRDLMLAEGRTAMCPLAHEMMYERDRYRQALESIADMVDGHHEGAYQAAHDALDSTTITITHEEAVSDAEAVLEDHYIYGKE